MIPTKEMRWQQVIKRQPTVCPLRSIPLYSVPFCYSCVRLLFRNLQQRLCSVRFRFGHSSLTCASEALLAELVCFLTDKFLNALTSLIEFKPASSHRRRRHSNQSNWRLYLPPILPGDLFARQQSIVCNPNSSRN